MKKILSIGEKEISIGLDRAIVCEVVDKFNDFFADLYNAAADAIDNKSNIDEQNDSQNTAIKNIAEKIRNKQVSFVLMLPDKKLEVMTYAMPKLIKKGCPDYSLKECQQKAKEIIDYCYDNEAENLLADAIFDFINEGFTADEAERKPKITVTLN